MVSGDVLKLECGALVVGIPAGGLTPTAEALDKASEGVVSRWIEAGDIHPCVGKVAVFRDFPGCKAERVVFVGLGKCKRLPACFKTRYRQCLPWQRSRPDHP